jgi:hypothetical protein
MPTHDIIDNRSEKLVDHFSQMLGKSERTWIDRMAYELHGLTENELAVVESGE